MVVGTFFALAKPPQSKAASSSFTFTADGDYGQTSNTTKDLQYIGNLAKSGGTAFNLALGDLNYDYPNVSADSWSNYVKSYLPANFPFEIVIGEHDTGDMTQLEADLPDYMNSTPRNSTNGYGLEYYFDYPANNPLARFIMLDPGPMVSGVNFNQGGADYNWTQTTIENARKAGINWIIVGLHRYCIDVSDPQDQPCTAPDLMNLLISEKVDLVMTGQKHGYQATKQLAFSSRCTSITPGKAANTACIVSSSTSLTEGKGTVFVITGTGGKSLGDVDPSSDPETPYFRTWEGGNANPTWGVSQITISANQLSFQFHATSGGTFKDSFTISG
jgi:hypothetical protein